ncbi:MAG: dimethyl sulfoxide reductase anchor subunit [Nitrospirota bacterium]|nr:dimethyl sulfoxide reductase anchor subunit [Nitrospirota bacterium]
MKNQGSIELIGPIKQKVWGWPVVINAIFGGLGAGLYVILFFMQAFSVDPDAGVYYRTPGLLPPLLMGLGFLALAYEAGHPMKGYHLVRNLRSSWMSAEVIAGAALILSSAGDFFFPDVFIKGIALGAATGFLACQGLIFYRAGAVTSWNVSIIPVLFIISSLFMGMGFVLLLAGTGQLSVGPLFLFVAIVFAIVDLALWIWYVSGDRGPAFRKSTEALRRPFDVGITVGAGHLIPVMLLSVLFLLSPFEQAMTARHVMAFLCGICISAGGIWQKRSVILNTDYLRGIEIGKPGYCVAPAGSVQRK